MNEGRVDIALERIAALDRLAAQQREHYLEDRIADRREHDRELILSDTKFAKANEVREQIDRERGNFATRLALDELRETFRREQRQAQDEADRRVKALEEKRSVDTGAAAGRATFSAPLVALIAGVSGSVLTYLLIQAIAK